MIFKKAFKDSIPVLMGYTTMGAAAGVLLAVQVGVPYAPIWAVVMAAVLLSGTMQFAIVAPMVAGDPLIAVALLTIAISFRYGFYGFSLIDKWKNVPFLKKCYMIHLLADEGYALMCAAKYEKESDYLKYCVYVGTLDLSYWIVGLLAGGIIGTILRNAQIPTEGVDFTMASLFLVIFTDQIRGYLQK